MPRSLPLKGILLLLFISTACLFAGAQSNLLRNGGFEQLELDTMVYSFANSELSSFPLNDTALGWNFGKRQMVIVLARDWNFQNYAWHANMTYYSDSGYGHTGKVFGLITAYDIGPYHILSIQNLSGKLCSPLVTGHRYKVSFYLKAFEGNCFTNQVSVGFTESFTQTGFVFEKDEVSKNGKDIPVEKAYSVPGILKDTAYQQFSFEYKAKGNEQFIYIGNFHLGYMAKENYQVTDWFSPIYSARKRPYVAYAIDDIVIEPLDTSEGCIRDSAPDKETATALVAPDTLQLPSIYFGYNDTTSPDAFTKIVDAVNKANGYKRVLIYGFTDNAGSLAYNQQLSEQRAQFVAQKFRDITAKIVEAKGLGLSTADMDAQFQRRVDIYLVK